MRLSWMGLVAVAIVGFGGGRADASFYPPGHEVERSCQQNGPVQVCAINQHGGLYPRLEISYRGFLRREHWGGLKVFVKLNGNSGTFRMRSEDGFEFVALNEPIARLCWIPDSAGLQGVMPRMEPWEMCQNKEAIPGGGFAYEVIEPLEAERRLFLTTADAAGNPRAWKVEVAVVSQDGRWDSRYGENYRFRFE